MESALAALSLAEAIDRIETAGGQAVLVRTCKDLLADDAPGRSSNALTRDVEGRSAKGLPWQCGFSPLPPPPAIVPLGFDNEAIVVGRLGRSPADYARLLRDRIIASKPAS
jgi:hypothetical protein